MLKAEEYTEKVKEVVGVSLKITSYKIGDLFHCHVSNVDPGANIARSHGNTAQEAEELALKKAISRLA